MDNISSDMQGYNGRVPISLRDAAVKAYNTYRADKLELTERVRDNEMFYRSFYDKTVPHLKKHMHCETPFLFSCIENACADASENYPVPNILEREPAGTEAAQALSKLLPVQLEMSRFNRIYKDNTLNKCKFGTAIYGVFYNAQTEDVDMRAIDIMDIYVDMHLENIQDSKFMFISAAIDNDVLKAQYPQHARLFEGDAQVDGVMQSYTLGEKTQVLDCYYKKPDGTLHMMKLCRGTIIEATEDMEGYEDGMYSHGKYPVVFDVMFPQKGCPFGFGMIDIGKCTQVEIDKLDKAITTNIMICSRNRYLTKRNNGVNPKELADIENAIVCYDGEGDGIKEIEHTPVTQQALNYRDTKCDNLKETLGNRDFQQGQTSGGVTAASAIQTLRETGEKRSRKMIDDTYESYKEIVYMTIELIRQFYDTPRTYRVNDEYGQKSFIEFSNEEMSTEDGYEQLMDENGEEYSETRYRPIRFDVEVIPQKENPYTKETRNQTILTLWNSGFFLPQNSDAVAAALKSMSFDGKEQLMSDLNGVAQQAAQEQQAAQGAPAQAEESPLTAGGEGLVPIDLNELM